MTQRELHFAYGISYLVLIIIALIAFALFDVPNLVDKIAFALTMTSLVLAIVAIVYTFITASKQESQLGKLIETNNSISQASRDIGNVASSLLGQVTAIPDHIQKLTEKIDRLSEREVKVISEESSVEPSDSPTEAQFHRFLVSLPFGAMMILYAFFVAQRKDKVLTERSMSNWQKLPFNFTLGFLSGTDAAGFIKFSVHKNEIIPISCAKVVVDHLRDGLNRIIKVVDEKRGQEIKLMMEQADREFS
jgi:signal transduction histidine kinase